MDLVELKIRVEENKEIINGNKGGHPEGQFPDYSGGGTRLVPSRC